MKHACLTVLLLAAGAAHAADRGQVSIGADYSRGTYGGGTATGIASVPVAVHFASGSWSFRAGVPWLRVDGDPTVVPGLGSTPVAAVGRLGCVVPIGCAGTGDTRVPGVRVSGLGDVSLAASYGMSTEPVAASLTVQAKLATADESRGLGTGSNDYGVALDLQRDIGRTAVFGGVGVTVLGRAPSVDERTVASASAGFTRPAGNGQFGAVYDWREAALESAGERREVSGFFRVPAGPRRQFQVHATHGLARGSADWGAGVGFTAGF